jgi:ubiquinone/menaquinone biosynthesis C-methylase UbiE
MNFKIKNLLQQILSSIPFSNYFNRFFQIYISRSLPISTLDLESRKKIASKHIENFKLLNNNSIPNSLLDVGAGADLAIPIIYAQMGVNRVVGSDIYPLATPFLVGNILKRLELGSLKELNIDYVTYKGQRMPFIDQEFDFITTTSVLEHVPFSEIRNLILETYRCLSKNGMASHYIAHIDHWSHTDSSLHPMNYLRYSDVKWKYFNPSLNFQNRLLQSEYVKLFEDCGFQILMKESYKCELPEFSIDDKFMNCSIDDLTTTHSWIVVKKI